MSEQPMTAMERIRERELDVSPNTLDMHDYRDLMEIHAAAAVARVERERDAFSAECDSLRADMRKFAEDIGMAEWAEGHGYAQWASLDNITRYVADLQVREAEASDLADKWKAYLDRLHAAYSARHEPLSAGWHDTADEVMLEYRDDLADMAEYERLNEDAALEETP